jgi:hypothetical protein
LATESAVLRETSFVLQAFWRQANVDEGHLDLSSASWQTTNQKSMKIGEPQAQLAIFLRDSKSLREGLA